MASIKNVSIVLKPKNITDFEVILPNLVSWLLRRKKNIYFISKEKERLTKTLKSEIKNVSFCDELDIYDKSELIITLGGDGTLIGVSRAVKKNSPPIFGVNMGNLGFITEFSKSEFFDELESTLKGNFELTTFSLQQVEVFKKEKSIFKGYFLNDIVINNNQISRMLTLTVQSDSEHIYNLSGDGLIISSPIGSTAYSLAAGGPIIHPEVNAITLTPICAHSLTHRPLVVSENSIIEVKAQKSEDSLKITLDGQQSFVVSSGETIVVTKAKNKNVKLIKNPNRTYFRTLKEKFTHGAREIK
jgi:NAD+ kinase